MKLAEEEGKLLIDQHFKWLKDNLDAGKEITTKTVWELMDEVWDEIGCSDLLFDEKITEFYSHPVWLLNGLHVDNDETCIKHREVFADYVDQNGLSRIADFGGGFGTFSRLVASRNPKIIIDIIEPHPNIIAKSRLAKFSNIKFRENFDEKYDLISAIDVFEHIYGPLDVLSSILPYLKNEGELLCVNSFMPLIKCHLPQNFHFNQSWDYILKRMGLEKKTRLIHSTIYIKIHENNLSKKDLDNLIHLSKNLWYFTKFVHHRIGKMIYNVTATIYENSPFKLVR